jgi:hypothetical protein
LVVVVLVEVGFVAVPVLLEDEVLVELVVGLVDVVVGVEDVEEDVDDEVLVLELLVELELVQAFPANSPTVVAPWPRFRTRVVFTFDGSAATSLSNVRAALSAAPH